ncbi:hypothetical protein THAOC_01410 [Thalassiosira oceanica]|uniref:Uncharacterized protein n=1 Tax=Thalassiosira oceanica TaxID=159749 RepID=K0TN37_THAOC|nr:hypothetical protein THAOC_01410 [Thalassiosira oceanica]|eukprot:EJK76806.1 hypothetical protein THAOC_01410 [Thalassiosira oceanica]
MMSLTSFLGGTRSLTSTLGDVPQKFVDLNIFVYRSSISQSRVLARGWTLITVIAKVARPGMSGLAYLVASQSGGRRRWLRRGPVLVGDKSSRLEVKFQKRQTTSNEPDDIRRTTSSAVRRRHDPELRVAAKALAEELAAARPGPGGSVDGTYPPTVCLKEEEWRTLWTAPGRSNLCLSLSVSRFPTITLLYLSIYLSIYLARAGQRHGAACGAPNLADAADKNSTQTIETG